ncbi:MAG: hypothetical protein Fur0021_02620 [Candidatus Promineifilaceae bacterium]
MNKVVYQLQIEGPERTETFIVPAGVTRIGRTPGNDLELSHQFVSSRHAQIVCDEAGCQFTDLGSTNGTLLNGEKLVPHTPVPLVAGSAIQIGPYRLTVQVAVVETEPEPAPPPAPEPLPPEQAVEFAPLVAAAAPPSPGFALTPDAPPPGLAYHSERWLNYLPGSYHTDFMARFLGIFESILTPVEWTIDNFDLYLSAATSPQAFLPWLANWYAITFDATWSEAQRRAFLAEAHQLYARRGTRWALQRVLEIYTGVSPEIVDLEPDQDPFVFTVRLPLPANQVNRALLEQIIDTHKPAHTSYRLLFRA